MSNFHKRISVFFYCKFLAIEKNGYPFVSIANSLQ